MRRRGRFLFAATIALVAAAIVTAPGALAASSADIYKDYADNGRIDGHYSRADLERALQDASVQGYGKPTVKVGFRPAIQKELGAQGALQTTRKKGGLPFTGLDLGLMVAGGALLLLGGLSLRRFGRAKT